MFDAPLAVVTATPAIGLPGSREQISRIAVQTIKPPGLAASRSAGGTGCISENPGFGGKAYVLSLSRTLSFTPPAMLPLIRSLSIFRSCVGCNLER